MSSTITIRYRLAPEAQRAEFARSGAMPGEMARASIDAGPLTPDQRATLWDWHVARHPGDLHIYDADCLGLVQVVGDTGDARMLPLVADHLLSVAEILERLPAETEQTRAALAEARAIREQYRAKVAAERAEREAAEAARKAAAQAEAEAFAQEREAWAAAHGSEHLRRAVAAGYSCTSLYLRERAQVEYPAFTVDLARNARWQDRACPSLAALNVVDAVRAEHGEDVAEARVIWLTAPALTRQPEPDEYDALVEEWEPREAVLVRDRHYRDYVLIAEM